MKAPSKIALPGHETVATPADEIITAWVKGKRVMMTPAEAVSMINQVSGVLLAYEYTK